MYEPLSRLDACVTPGRDTSLYRYAEMQQGCSATLHGVYSGPSSWQMRHLPTVKPSQQQTCMHAYRTVLARYVRLASHFVLVQVARQDEHRALQEAALEQVKPGGGSCVA